MDTKSRAQLRWSGIALGLLALLAPMRAAGQAQAAPQTLPTHVSLEQAIDLALKHNHALQAARTTISENQAAEITANLRPNPVGLIDAQYLPFFSPQAFTHDYVHTNAVFDLGFSYTFERGRKRQRRLEAARDQTSVTRETVTDNERVLTANVSQDFIGVLLAKANVDLAKQDLASFQQTVDISQASFQAGKMSEGDLLKIKLQLLQFQMDLSSAKLAEVQALASLRQLMGYESVPEKYEVDGDLNYEQVRLNLDDLKMSALQTRPDLLAAQLSVKAAESQYRLAQANGKQDLGMTFTYNHLGGVSVGSLFFNMPIPIFDRNQGEIARTRYAIGQSQELSSEQATIALTDVANAYEGVRTTDEVVQLYKSGYLKQAEDSRDISQYAYQRGAASLLDFLDAERGYRATELAYRQALASYMSALEQLRQAVGTRSLP